MNYILLTIYLVFLLSLFVIITVYRTSKISQIAKGSKRKLLNKKYLNRFILCNIVIALTVGCVVIIFTEDNLLFKIVDVFITLFIQILLLSLAQIYTLSMSLIYNYEKIFLYYKSQIVEFEKENIRFVKENSHTLMFYKDDLVVNTKQRINTKILKDSLI
ncbi:MAG: hypothetical protein K6G28_02115 [Acholeplasmatales bacterium]|nr:hypothetical protein [Acholeplasmatales bacterium]